MKIEKIRKGKIVQDVYTMKDGRGLIVNPADKSGVQGGVGTYVDGSGVTWEVNNAIEVLYCMMRDWPIPESCFDAYRASA